MFRQFAEIQRRRGQTLDALAQSFERVEPLFNRDEFGVGDGVGGTCEQIGEADLRAHGGGQHAQRQIKRTRGGAEQIGQQFFARFRHRSKNKFFALA